MQAMLCGCGARIDGVDEGGLVEDVVAHLRRDHGMKYLDEVGVREMVAARSYRYECVEVAAGSHEPDEGFGPEPY